MKKKTSYIIAYIAIGFFILGVFGLFLGDPSMDNSIDPPENSETNTQDNSKSEVILDINDCRSYVSGFGYKFDTTCVSEVAIQKGDIDYCADIFMGSRDNGMIDQGSTARCMTLVAIGLDDKNLCDSVGAYDPQPYDSPLSEVKKCLESFD